MRNSLLRWSMMMMASLFLRQCGVMKDISPTANPRLYGMEDLIQECNTRDTLRSILISKAEAILTYDDERYEVELTLYSKRDSIIYLSAVNSGFEILRASVKQDSIKVIDRLNKIVYTTPLEKRFGYQYPVNFNDLQNLIDKRYLCDDLGFARDDQRSTIVFDFDERYIKKRIILNRMGMDLDVFEFYHQKTNQYLMGEYRDEAIKIYSNFMIAEFEISANGGKRSFNREIDVKMEVNPRKYTFTEVR